MKVVVQVKLLPDAEQASALATTLSMVNEMANWVSAVGFERYGLKVSVRELRTLCYGELKARGLAAQAAQHVIKRGSLALPSSWRSCASTAEASRIWCAGTGHGC